MEAEFLINAGPLVDAIKTLKPFISTEDARYYLNGVFFELEEGKDEINLVATDGHKLCVLTLPVDRAEDFDGAIAAIVPKKALETILAMLKGVQADWPLALRFTGEGVLRRLFVDAPDEKAEFKLIDGTYPDYRRVIPGWTPNFTVGLGKAQAKEAVKAIAAHRGKDGLRWELKDDVSPITLRGEGKTVVVMPMRVTIPGEPMAKADPNQTDLEEHLGGKQGGAAA